VGEIPDRVAVRKVFSPNPSNAAVYDLLFGQFVELYKQTKGIHKRLNRF